MIMIFKKKVKTIFHKPQEKNSDGRQWRIESERDLRIFHRWHGQHARSATHARSLSGSKRRPSQREIPVAGSSSGKTRPAKCLAERHLARNETCT